MTDAGGQPSPLPAPPGSALPERKLGRGFCRLAEAVSQPVWAGQADGTCDFANRAWSAATGQAAEAALALGWLEAVPEAERARALACWRSGTAGGEAFEFPLRLRCAGGAARACRVRVEPLDDAGGTWFATAHGGAAAGGAAAELAADGALRTSLETLLECVGIFTAVRGPAGGGAAGRAPVVDFRVEYLNAAAVANAGRPAAELLGRRLSEVAPAQAASGLLDEYRRVVETGQPFGRDTLCYDGTRGRRWYDLRVTRLGDGFVAAWRDVTDRKRAADAARESASRFRQFADGLDDAIWMTDPRGPRTLYVSRAYERMWGRTCQDLYDHPDRWLEAVHPDDQALVRRAYGEALAHGFQEEYRVVRPDGSVVWVRDRGFPIRDEAGRVLHLAGLAEDVTDRRRAEEASRASEARFRGVFEASVVPLWFWHADGRILDANDAFLRLLGLGRADVAAGRVRWDRLTPPEHLDRDARALEELRATGRCTPFEKDYRRPDGTRVPVLVGRSLLPGGADTGVAFAIDLSAQKRVEGALRASEERFRLATEALSGFVYDWDLESGRISRSRGLADVLGFAPEEVPTALAWWNERLHPDDRAAARAVYEEAVQARALVVGTEYRARHKGGQWVWLWDRSRLVYGEDGRPQRLVGCTVSIDARKRAEEALLLHARVLDSMTEGVNVSNESGVIVYTNPAEDAMFGYGRGELLGRHVSEQNDYAPEENARIVGEVIGQLRERGVWFGEFRNRKRDGTPFVTFARITALEIEGRPHWVCVQEDVTERLRAERALHDSEERLRYALGAAQAGVWEWEVATGRNVWSPENCTVYGRDPGLGSPTYAEWEGMLHPDDLARVNAAVRDALQGRTPEYRAEFRILHPARGVRWVLGVGRVERGPDGAPTRMAGINLDVTGRKEAELALAQSERAAQRHLAELQATYDTAPIGLCVFDRDLRWVRINERLAEINGYPPAAHLGRTVRELLPQLADQAEAELRRVLETGRPLLNVEVIGETPARPGETRAWRESFFPLRDADGAVIGINVVCEEVTDRKQAEAALRDSEERFRALADNVAQLAWMADSTGELFWYNRRWYDYTGTTLGEMRGSGWRRVHHPDHLARVEEKYRRCVAAGEAWEDTFPLRGQDGRYRWFLSRAVPIHDEQGRVTLWFGTNTDVTAQREVEEALKEADRRKDDFLAMLGHELRNPLGPIRNAVQVLRLLGPPEPRLVQARDMIDRQVAHMTRLIDDLLDASRIARGKIKLRKEACDLAAVVRTTCEDYRGQLEANGLALRVQVPAEPLPLLGDATRLAQVVSNVLHNAGKFTPGGGRVTVTLEAAGGWAAVTVRDTGLGMEPEMLRRVFEPFSQADRSLDRERGGLGLGLALVKGLVALHGGTATATSAGLGRGTEVAIRLPLGVPADALPPPAPPPPPLPPRAHRVLVIEDHPDAARSMRALLQLAGHQVEIAFTGRDGLQAARAWRPDVVLCDIGLPGLDGYAVARALRADPDLCGAYLVAVTGYGQEEDQRRALEAGFDVHLVKPVDHALLQNVLANLPPRGDEGRPEASS